MEYMYSRAYAVNTFRWTIAIDLHHCLLLLDTYPIDFFYDVIDCACAYNIGSFFQWVITRFEREKKLPISMLKRFDFTIMS